MQGQELQETGFYQYKWRQYMPDVGRFFNIDPLATKYPYNSTYAFSENAVVAHRELEGLEKIHFSYVFTQEQISVTKTILDKQGPLGNGILVSSNHGGKMSYYYGKVGTSSLSAFKKYYEGANTDKNGNHIGYNDHLGNPTIGYGHLIKKGDPYKVGSSISESEAQSLFESDSQSIISKANTYLDKYDLADNELNALYDASFNMGPGKMSQYKQDGSKYSGGSFFLQFMGGGDGLKKRRYAENLLYTEGISVNLDVLKGKSTQQIVDYLNNLAKDDNKEKKK